MSEPNPFDLAGKVAVVTGALGLIGKEHCRGLAAAGASVVVTDVNHDGCVAFAEELAKAFGVPTLGVGADIRTQASVEALRDAVLARFGTLHVLVNNAAVDDKFESPAVAAERSKFENYPLEMFQRMIEVNVVGMFLCSQVLGKVLADAGRGSIINVASTYGLVAPQQSLYVKPDGSQSFWKSPAYPTTKGAVVQFTRFLASYWGQAGVRVNTLCPGGVENGQDDWFQANYGARTPLGRMAKPWDYRGAVVFLASDASLYMTGSNVVVDGGWTAW